MLTLMEASRQRITHAEVRSWSDPRGELVLTRTLGATHFALGVPLLDVLGSQMREPVARLGHLPAQEPELHAGQAVCSRRPARSARPELGRCRACGQPLSDPQSAARGWGPLCWQEQLLRQPGLREQLGPVPQTPRRLRQVLRVVLADDA